MNASADAPALGALERLTSSTAFRILFGFAVLLVAPVMLAGWVATPIMLLLAASHDWVWAVLPTAAGTVGIVGWIRAHRPLTGARSGTPELTMACLAIGIAAALVPSVFAAAAWIDVTEPDEWAWVATAFAAAHVIVALRAIGWIQRLARDHATRTSQRFDAIPLVFLLVAVALAVGAFTINMTLLELPS